MGYQDQIQDTYTAIAHGKLDQALELMGQIGSSPDTPLAYTREWAMLNAGFIRLKRAQRAALLTQEQHSVEVNRITKAALELLGILEGKSTSEQAISTPEHIAPETIDLPPSEMGEQLKSMLEKDDLQPALDFISNWLAASEESGNKALKNEILLLTARYSAVQRSNLRGLSTQAETARNINQIRHSAIEIASRII